jgi:hypothetical protein
VRTSMFTGADVVEAAKRHLDDLDAMQHASGVAFTRMHMPLSVDMRGNSSLATRLHGHASQTDFPGHILARDSRRPRYPISLLLSLFSSPDRTKNAVLTSQHIRDGRLRSADVRADSCKVYLIARPARDPNPLPIPVPCPCITVPIRDRTFSMRSIIPGEFESDILEADLRRSQMGDDRGESLAIYRTKSIATMKRDLRLHIDTLGQVNKDEKNPLVLVRSHGIRVCIVHSRL